jgi:FK506-binding nuclear protein
VFEYVSLSFYILLHLLGLVVEPSKLYSQQVPSSFKITMASLGTNKELEETPSTGKSQRTSLIFNLDNKEDFTLCSLTSEKVEQQPLDLVLTEGETIAFRVEGPHSIHLSGYYINEEDEHDDFINDEDEDEDEVYSDEAEEDSQIEYDSELEDEEYSGSDSEVEIKSKKNPRIRVLESDEEDEEDDSEFDSEDDEEMDSEEDEEEEDMDSEEESEEESEMEMPSKDAKKVKFDLTEAKKVKEAAKESPKAPAAPARESPKAPTATAKVSPPPAKAAPVAAATTPSAKPASPQAKEQGPTPVKKTLPSGLQIEDLKLGSGAKVSQGKKVLIHYKGTLLNGSVFDSSFGGKPLKFAVGKGEVIKGMDIGIVGMAVGGSRKLVIPGPLAYGNQALPKIPRNSTLVFEIRLEKIL